ncbi:MAG: M23 family metallopeptidase [Oscillospiraceae bacterium]
MGNKKSFGQKLENFFAGKGFYIVLFLCVAVIGVSAFFLLAGLGADVDELYENPVEANGSLSDDGEMPPELVVPPDGAEETPAMAEQEPVVDESLVKSEDTTQTGTWTEQAAESAASALFVWPLQGEIDLPYSVTALVYNKKMGDWRTNAGIDIAATLGTQVLAVSSGRVESIETTDLGGVTLVIEHAGGVRSIYANLAETPTVAVDDSITSGEVIGAVGVSAVGETKEHPHLCFSMTLDGQSVNPADYLPTR